ncbi:integrase, catalytic region, zinc finger, CCHC-type containing protein [Tanacetum coccineum]
MDLIASYPCHNSCSNSCFIGFNLGFHKYGQAVQIIIPNNAAFQTEDRDTYDSNCDDISNAKAVLMANISNYGSDVISEVSYSETNLNDMENQSVLAMQDFEQSPVVDFTNNEIHNVLLTVMNSMSLNGESVNMERKRNESCDKCFNLDDKLLKSQNAHTDLLKSYSQLEKNCISLELSIQLNQEIFQKDESCNNQNALEILEFFKHNDLKAQLQDKDTTICKLKEIIKSMREKSKEDNVNYDYCEIETKNVELENSVVKLLSENERLCKEINHVKQVFKEQTDLIKKTRVHTKEYSDSLIDKLNLKSAENKDLKAQIQDKVFVITSLKNDLQKLKGKEIVDLAAQTPSSYTIIPGMFKLDLEPLAPRIEVKHSLLNVNSEPICATCKKSMFDGVHDMCLLDFVENVNSHAKSAKKHKNQNIWKPTGHVFTKVGFKWKPTGSTFAIVGNSCPLTRITSANVVPPKKTTSYSIETQKPELKVYSRKPKNVVQIVLWYLDSGCSKHMIGNRSQLMNFVSKFLGIVRFGNDHIARIMGYGDYQLGNATILRVYYVEGLGHNFFSTGQFCDADLEVAFWKNTFFIRNLEGVDLLSRSRDTNLYTISLDDMLKTSTIRLLSKASKIKSWLWHRRLSYLNFGTLNKLAKDGLARGIPRLKF